MGKRLTEFSHNVHLMMRPLMMRPSYDAMKSSFAEDVLGAAVNGVSRLSLLLACCGGHCTARNGLFSGNLKGGAYVLHALCELGQLQLQ